MRCWACAGWAEGVCRFCGRATCKAHARTRPFLFEAWPSGDQLRGLAVEDALYCGICKPHPEPVTLSNLMQIAKEER